MRKSSSIIRINALIFALMASTNPTLCYDPQEVYGNNENHKESYFQASNNDTLRIFTSPHDSPEYQQYAKNLFEGKSSLKDIVKFLKKGEISAFKTALTDSSLPNNVKFEIIDLYLNQYPTNIEVLEVAGTTYLNADNIEAGFKLYDKVLSIGKLSSDSLYNYFFTLLALKAHHKESVEKAWQMMQQWQQQFAGDADTPFITPQITQENPEITFLDTSYNLLFEVIKKRPSYHSILEKVIDVKDDRSTPTVVKMIITKALMVHFKGTPFESSLYRTTGFRMVTKQEMQEKGDNYEAALKRKLKKFTSELEMAKRALNEIVINNAQTILQHDVSLRDFPQERFPFISESQTLNMAQCSIWARKIINTCRRDLLRYEGDNPNIFNLLATLDNSTIETIITPYLQDFKGDATQSYSPLKSVIYNNLAVILQSHTDLLNFPRNYFKNAFDINQVTDNQYKIWARKVISKARQELLAYNGQNQQLLTTLNKIDNTHLEQYVAVELKNILKGSED